MQNEQQEIQLPFNKLSYSALTQLLRNPLIFKMKYILNAYDSKMGMAGMIGRAGHEVLKVYYDGKPDHPIIGEKSERVGLSMALGQEYLDNFNDFYINYGRKGSRAEMIAKFHKAMQFYWAEEPEYNEILLCEEKLEAELKTVDGQTFPMPAVGIPDLVHKRKDGGIEIIDHKFVKSFTRYENEDGTPHEDYIKIVQAQFLWHLLREAKGINCDRAIFREIKYTMNEKENKGTPQVRDYVIPFSHEQYRIFFYNLYCDVVSFISNPKSIYLPNFNDNLDGEAGGLMYSQGMISGDMSDVEVVHKVKDVAFQSKRFVASRLDGVENKYLPPEERIKMRLLEFGIPVEPVETKVGPSVTQYRFKVSRGIRMSVFEKHHADIARALEAKTDIRILAPIPGTDLVGVEVAAATRTVSNLTKDHLVPNTLSIPIGVTVHGEVIKVPLNEMPHLLIGGTTGSGKSRLLESVITSLVKQNSPEEMQLILIDPKRVELVTFKGAKHLHGGKIIYEYANALLALKGLAEAMEQRYKILEKTKCRNIMEYNNGSKQRMPSIVVVIDEFGDLILQGKVEERKKKGQRSLTNIVKRAQVEQMARQFAKMGLEFSPEIDDDDQATVEERIVRLASMGRAVGIHLILATQSPRADVVTGLIKANFPTRIALTVVSGTESKIIIDELGAEKLSGKGDLIFMHPGSGKLRLQGFMVK